MKKLLLSMLVVLSMPMLLNAEVFERCGTGHWLSHDHARKALPLAYPGIEFRFDHLETCRNGRIGLTEQAMERVLRIKAEEGF